MLNPSCSLLIAPGPTGTAEGELSGRPPGPLERLPEPERDRGPRMHTCPLPEAVEWLAGLAVCIG